MTKKQIKGSSKNSGKLKPERFPFSTVLFFGYLIVILPLIYSKQTLDHVLMPQLFAASIFTAIFWIVYTLFLKRHVFGVFRSTPIISWVLLVFMAATLFSSLFTINLKESFFDISKTIVFAVVIILALHLLSGNNSWQRFIPVFFLVSTSIALVVGFRQYFLEVMPTPDRLLADGRPVVYLVDGLMAHKNLYASSLFMSLPLLLFGLFQTRKVMRLLFGIVIVLVFLMVFLLSTRAVWLGLMVAIGITSLVLIIFSNQYGISAKVRKWILIAMVSTVVSGLFIITIINSGDTFSPVERIKSMVSSKDANNIYRLQVWDITLDMIKKNPITGLGSGNWKLVAPYSYHLFNFKVNQLNWISPHNDFLWVFAEKGIFGFVSYIGLFIMSFFYLFSVIRRTTNSAHRNMALLLIGGFSGYLVISFFDFPLERIVHQVWLGLWIALSTYLYMQLNIENPPVKRSSSVLAVIVAVILIFPVIYAYSASKLEVYVVKARKAQFRNNWNEMLEMANKIPTQFRNLDAEAMPVYYYQGMAYERTGKFELAKTYYQKANHDHPTKVEVLNNLGLMCFNLKQYEEAKQYFERAVAILPDFLESLVNISSTCLILEDYEKSLEYLNRIPKNQWDERFYQRSEYLNQQINLKSKK
ncbi:MAG: tetratricopeptide repeat protein [Bacteroidales bacterium]|nr:tetratricopeptide repeat protein [Bacteroidales bacterium]